MTKKLKFLALLFGNYPFKIITDFKKHWLSKVKIAYKYSMHRNSVLKIIKSFDQNIDP